MEARDTDLEVLTAKTTFPVFIQVSIANIGKNSELPILFLIYYR